MNEEWKGECEYEYVAQRVHKEERVNFPQQCASSQQGKKDGGG
jgi:hypothetical protein